MEITSISKNRQILGPDALELQGLAMLGHNLASRATNPLQQHCHEGLMEFVVLYRGNECYAVDGQNYRLSGGDVFITTAGQAHGNGGDSQGVCEFIWFQINPLASDLLGLSAQRAGLLRRQLLALSTQQMQADRECLTLLKKSMTEFLRMNENSRIYATGLFIAFIYRLLFLRQPHRMADRQIRQALHLIESSLAASVRLEELSRACGVSLSGFKHKFRECTGKTPRSYINQRKIEQAGLLLHQGFSVTDTAMRLGFESSAYFSSVFRKYMNMSPTQYIKGSTAFHGVM